ncbi:MAG TPA: cyclopropane-fatty-acyl-phospholipid synthase family protein [Verrucomicrobiae bacterium]|nr:cyclopropane-fatty-acyl-phospholipid synthase family protein [Verrucomicrobiae bacterium]
MSVNVIDWCERGLVPDPLARFGMRRLMAQRLRDESAGDVGARHGALVQQLRESPVAINTQDANAQHYEVPAEFFRLHLGPRLKYSCCLYGDGAETLAQAEEAMLNLYCERAGLTDGQRILDLGCGWGSLSLFLAKKFPRAQIVGLSNSNGQREFIEGRAAERGLGNVRIVTGNVVDFDFPANGVSADFDRIVSIEMFEHMRNYATLLGKVARWLRPGGQLFVHIFVHKTLAYPFEVKDGSDWMSQYFFTGGLMPSYDLLGQFQEHLKLEQQWWVDGTHYQRTSNHWLDGMDAARGEIRAVFAKAYGDAEADRWVQRWRMFYMAVAELFGYREGSEWGVGHYRFARRDGAPV